MHAENAGSNDLVARMERIERKNEDLARENAALARQARRAKQIGALALLLTAGAWTVAAAAPPPDVVEARQIILRDVNGICRAELAMTAEPDPQLTLFDGAGNERAVLGLSANNPHLSFSAAGGNAEIALIANSEGEGGQLLFYDADACARTDLSFFPSAGPLLMLRDAGGETVFEAP